MEKKEKACARRRTSGEIYTGGQREEPFLGKLKRLLKTLSEEMWSER